MNRRRVLRVSLLVLGGLLAGGAAVIVTQPLWAFGVLAWATLT